MSFPFVQPYFGLGNSLQTAQAAAGGGGAAGGWVELGRTTLGSDNTLLTVASLPDKRYYMILGDHSQAGSSIRLNGDTGTSYAVRRSKSGASDVTSVNRSSGGFISDSRSTPHFNVTYLSNLSSKEKLWQNQNVYQYTAGAGTAPLREEGVGKWINTSNAVDEFAYLAWASTYQTGDEVVVLGWDPEDTHTSNFWEELAEGTATSGDNLDTGALTEKKYYWIQAMAVGNGSDIRMSLRTGDGSIATTDYSYRRSHNGGTEETFTSADRMAATSGAVSDNEFWNIFVINNSGNEKLCIAHAVRQNTAGASNVPNRTEMVGKYAYTSGQLDRFRLFNDQAGDLASGSIIKVWGSD